MATIMASPSILAYRNMREYCVEWGMVNLEVIDSHNNAESSVAQKPFSKPSESKVMTLPAKNPSQQQSNDASNTNDHVSKEKKTKKLYVDGSVNAANIKVLKATDTMMVLDSTVFHPQGGGQPCDIGTITTKKGSIEFTVSMVKEDRATGLIEHTGVFTKGSVTDLVLSSDVMQLDIDVTRRIENTKNHSAGHLLDVVMTKLGFNLIPSKGYHFPDGPYVEYIGDVPADRKETLCEVLTTEINMLAQERIPSESRTVFKEEAKQLCPESNFDMFSENDSIRMICVGGGWCPCGGTHVNHVGEIGAVKVTKTRVKKGILRVNYEVTNCN